MIVNFCVEFSQVLHLFNWPYTLYNRVSLKLYFLAIQVRAAEVVKSEMYKTGVTLRFPRVEKVRYDKPWYDTLTTKELDSLVKVNLEKCSVQ